MKYSGLNRLAGLIALAAFVVSSAGASSIPPDVGFQQPGSALHFWLLPPELPVGQVPILIEQQRLKESRPILVTSFLADVRFSRGPPA